MLTADKFKRVGYTKEEAERIDRPTISYWQDAWRRLPNTAYLAVCDFVCNRYGI